MAPNKFSNAAGWDHTSSKYAERIEHVTSVAGDNVISMANDMSPFSPSSRVLDSGSGSGVLVASLARQYPNISILATDLSPKMLSLIDAKKLPNVETLVVDVMKEAPKELETKSFSHVLSTFMLQFVEHPMIAMKDYHRVLKDDGVVGIGIWGETDTKKPWMDACRTLDPNFEPEDDYFPKEAWRTEKELEKALKDAGFVDVKTKEVKMQFKFDSVEMYLAHWWDMKNPGIENMKSQWPGNVDEVRPVFDEIIKKKFEAGDKFCIKAILGVGRKK